jgi:hypothetical protein
MPCMLSVHDTANGIQSGFGTLIFFTSKFVVSVTYSVPERSYHAIADAAETNARMKIEFFGATAKRTRIEHESIHVCM